MFVKIVYCYKLKEGKIVTKLSVQVTHRALDRPLIQSQLLRWKYPLIIYLTHETEADETEGEVDNTDELVRENAFDLTFEDETQGNEVNLFSLSRKLYESFSVFLLYRCEKLANWVANSTFSKILSSNLDLWWSVSYQVIEMRVKQCINKNA